VKKYSVVIPVLNGYNSLSKTLPYMLKINRDDVEFVISENHSNDETYDFINTLNDPRIKLVRPKEQLPAGKNLEFAYLHATGEWQGHIGDDDVLMPNRFDIIDSILHDNKEVSVINTGYLRYFWNDYHDKLKANTLIPGKSFTGGCEIINGRKLAAELLNSKSVHGGGSWLVNKRIINQIRDRSGFFASPQNLEFFSVRASCALSKYVARIDLPLWIMGRHQGSSGTQALSRDSNHQESMWDWSFEDPDSFQYSPYQYKGYTPISLDGALRVKHDFSEELQGIDVDMQYWALSAILDIEKMIFNGKLPDGYQKLVSNIFQDLSFYSKVKLANIQLRKRIYQHSPVLLKSFIKSKINKLNNSRASSKSFGYSQVDAYDFLRANNIIEVAERFEEKYKHWYDRFK
jgi:glycosyltransferase involved in cell wall biosynthesis